MAVEGPSTPLLKLERYCNHRVSSSLDPPSLERSSAVLTAGVCRRKRGGDGGESCRHCSALLTEWCRKIAAAAAKGHPCSCQTPSHSNLGSSSGSFMPGFVLSSVGAAIFLVAAELPELLAAVRAAGRSILFIVICGCCRDLCSSLGISAIVSD
ncbi:uncharacterized protein LOC110271443 [Arachis ipaensis]|uniref:uncharacterized protein LOC110271443 n=1 Tax=Arachis ipaensis TaxID=130454 RepID=UPI000A2AF0BB|nr:uncharacterized protein LOC110271443 [Arachis ipaensis]